MSKMPTYSSKRLKINWAGNTFVGLAPDNFIEIAPNADITDEEVGADGYTSISFLPDETGLITINLQALSPTNQVLSQLLQVQKRTGDITSAEMTVVDPSGSVVAKIKDAHIKTAPTISRGSSVTGQTMSWVFFAQQVDFLAVPPTGANVAQFLLDIAIGVDLASTYLLGN